MIRVRDAATRLREVLRHSIPSLLPHRSDLTDPDALGDLITYAIRRAEHFGLDASADVALFAYGIAPTHPDTEEREQRRWAEYLKDARARSRRPVRPQTADPPTSAPGRALSHELVVRPAQLSILQGHAADDFRKRLRAHVGEIFPDRARQLGGALDGLIDRGLKKCALYGLRSERAVSLFVDMMLGVDEDFDRLPELGWARAILRQTGVDDEARMRMIFALLEERGAPERAEVEP